MTEYDRLIGMLQASKAENLARSDNTANRAPDPAQKVRNESKTKTESKSESKSEFESKRPAIPVSLVDALQVGLKGGSLPSKPTEPLSTNFNVALNHVLHALNARLPLFAGCQVRAKKLRKTKSDLEEPDLANDLAVETCKRIFAAKKDPEGLVTIAHDLSIPDNMASRFPSLTTSDLPAASASEQSATASPARGTAMLNSIFKSVRVPEFRFRWQFWAEKGQQSSSKDKSTSADDFALRPKPLGDQIISVKEFYQHFNNIPLDTLKMRDSIHLFHVGVKPLWEDPRNSRGGAYYFRIGKDVAPQFWHEICLLAVGDVLQGAVETKRDGELHVLLPFA